MAAIFANSGEREVLDRAFYAAPQPSYWMHLYQNDYTPTYDDAEDASDYTPADFDGYLPVEITGWSPPATTSGVAATTAAECTFTAGAGLASPQTVYGYYVTLDEAGTSLLWAERFVSGPFTFTNPGDLRRISPTVNLRALGQP